MILVRHMEIQYQKHGKSKLSSDFMPDASLPPPNTRNVVSGHCTHVVSNFISCNSNQNLNHIEISAIILASHVWKSSYKSVKSQSSNRISNLRTHFCYRNRKHCTKPLQTCTRLYFMWFLLKFKSYWDNYHDFGQAHGNPESKVSKTKSLILSEATVHSSTIKHRTHCIRPLYACARLHFMLFILKFKSLWDNFHDFGQAHNIPFTKVWTVKAMIWSLIECLRCNNTKHRTHHCISPL